MARKTGAAKIVQKLEAHRAELRRLGVKRIGLFGSAARGQLRKGSDLDFLVVLDRPSFDSYMDVKFLLEKLFRRKADVVTEAALKPALQQVKEDALYAEV